MAEERCRIGEVPLLIVRPVDRWPPLQRPPLPTVLWFHGLGADKELHLPELQRFADAGMLALGVDAVGHGQRRLADFERQFAQPPESARRVFDSLVAQTVDELPALIDTLVERGLSDPERIGVAGVSMGGCIVYGAICSEARVRAAVALMGSPAWLHPEGAEFLRHRCFPTALLSITAENDNVVPPAAARALHDQLLTRYGEQPDRLDYRVIPGATHFMAEDDWRHAVGDAASWLARFLTPAR